MLGDGAPIVTPPDSDEATIGTTTVTVNSEKSARVSMSGGTCISQNFNVGWSVGKGT